MHRILQITLATLILLFLTAGFFGAWPEFMWFAVTCLLTMHLLARWACELNYMRRTLQIIIGLIALLMVSIGTSPISLGTWVTTELWYAGTALLAINLMLRRIERLWTSDAPRHIA